VRSLKPIFFFTLALAPGVQAKEVDIKEPVSVGGIQQWITVKGASENPLLLFLHGGPGNSVMAYADKFTKDLQSHFLIVQWDQRESGRTLELNKTNKPLTTSLFVSDAIELIQLLKGRYSKEKIYLMGQSWGGFLALQVAHIAPELLEVCLAVSPMIHQVESEKRSLARMMTQVKERKDSTGLRELMQVKIPFEKVGDLYTHRKWIAVLDGRKPPEYSFVETWCRTWLSVFNEAANINLFTQTSTFACPVYFFVGRNDYQTHFQLTEDYFRQVHAPRKDLFWFEKSSHSPHITESEKFQQLILSVLTNTKK
jgi:pimeloyl-ACP methyl ester carboxylesterase